MAHDFTPREEEPEAQAAGGRAGSPPRKHTAVGVIDPPVPPKTPVGPIPASPRPVLSNVMAWLVLVGAVLLVLAILWKFL